MAEININWKSVSHIENWEKIVKFEQCLEPTGVEMGFGAANIQSLKEKIMKMVKTENHIEKGDSKS